MLPDVPLTDGVVTLRPWRVEEADWYVAQVSDPPIQRFTGEPPDLTPAAVRAAIADMLATRAHAGMAITDAATGELLGNAGLAPKEAGLGEVSYWVSAPARGVVPPPGRFGCWWTGPGSAGCAGCSCIPARTTSDRSVWPSGPASVGTASSSPSGW